MEQPLQPNLDICHFPYRILLFERLTTFLAVSLSSPFGAWSSSSTDDEFIPNDIYFGTPDRVFTANTKIKCQRQKQLNERYSAKYGRSGKRRYSDDSDGEERRKRKQKLDQLSRLNLPSYQQAQLQTMIKKKKKRRQDRFYDKSQDIPNDIYFGNVNGKREVRGICQTVKSYRSCSDFQFRCTCCTRSGTVRRRTSGPTRRGVRSPVPTVVTSTTAPEVVPAAGDRTKSRRHLPSPPPMSKFRTH